MNYKLMKMKLIFSLNVLKTICIFSLLFWCMPFAFQVHASGKVENLRNVEQDMTVQGKVIDENGDAVIGASILVVRTGGGTITDIDGNFSLSVRKGDELRLSYVGYQTMQVVVTSNVMNIQLVPSSETLDEVIVVGYGTQRVRDLTGAATNVNMDEIAELPGTSIIDALAGQVIGLNVSQSKIGRAHV